MAYSITSTASYLSYGAATWVLYSTSDNVVANLPSGCRVAGSISNVQASKSGLYCYTGTNYGPANYGFISWMTQNISGTIDGIASSVSGTRNYCGQIVSSRPDMFGDCTFTLVPNSGYRAYGWLWGRGWGYQEGKFTTGFLAGDTISTYFSAIVSENYPACGIVPIERKYYIVKYNGNGATSGSMSDDEFFYGKNYSLSSCGFSRNLTVTYNATGGTPSRSSDDASFSFLGWATSSSGSVAYTNGQTVSNLTSTAGGIFNLYAKWGGSSAVITLPNATKPGAVFAGWYTAASGGTRVGGSGDTYTPTANVTLYAQWTPYITIVFSPNGGYISDGAYFKNILEGSTYGTLPTASRPGYTFLGWFTDPTSGMQITSESVILPYDHTIYAHWQGATVTHTLYFDPAGGTCSTASKTVTPGVAYGTLPTATRGGYSFLGWFLSTIGTDQVTAATIAGDDDQTVYAHWQGDSLTITFNANGGSVSETTRTVIYGNQYSTLPIPTYSGKNFVGWFTAATGGTQVSATDVPTANTTLYAHWEEGVLWWQI